jgi:hypothetical protein
MQIALLCPQCGVKIFYVTKDHLQYRFHVGPDYRPFPVEKAPADLSGLDFSRVNCTGCSWSGSPKSLVKFFHR